MKSAFACGNPRQPARIITGTRCPPQRRPAPARMNKSPAHTGFPPHYKLQALADTLPTIAARICCSRWRKSQESVAGVGRGTQRLNHRHMQLASSARSARVGPHKSAQINHRHTRWHSQPASAPSDGQRRLSAACANKSLAHTARLRRCPRRAARIHHRTFSSPQWRHRPAIKTHWQAQSASVQVAGYLRPGRPCPRLPKRIITGTRSPRQQRRPTVARTNKPPAHSPYQHRSAAG